MRIKQTKTIYLVILFLLFISVSSSMVYASKGTKTGAGKQYTLRQLVALAEKNNLPVKISELDKDIATEEYRDARALPNPQLEYAGGRADIPGEPGKAKLWEIGLRWSAPNPIYRYFFLKSKKTFIKEAEIKAEIKKKEIIKGLKIHFYRLQLYQKIKVFLEEKLRILNEVSRITKAKVSIGESKEIYFLRSSVEIQKNKTRLFQVQKIIASERTNVKELLNYTLPDDFTIVEDFSSTPLPDIEEGIRKRIDKSPLILLKTNRLDRENKYLKAARFSIIESVEFFAEREKEVEGKLWRVGIGIAVPLFNWKSAHTRKAKYQKERARMEFEHAKKHFFADIQRMVSGIRVLEKEIETFKGAILKEGRVNMELSEKLYKEGEVPLVVFLDSQNSFFEIEERYYEAISEWNILKAELEAVLGEE